MNPIFTSNSINGRKSQNETGRRMVWASVLLHHNLRQVLIVEDFRQISILILSEFERIN